MGKNTLTLMAKRIRQLMATVDRLSERLKILENKDTWESYISQEDTPCQYIFYICKVTSLVPADKIFYARVQEPYTTNSSPWMDDGDITNPITVSYPNTTSAMTVGDVVRVDFTGTYGSSFLPRYGWFDLSSTSSVGGETGVGTISVVTSIAVVSGALQIYKDTISIISTVTRLSTTVTTVGTLVTGVVSIRVNSLDLQAAYLTAAVIDVTTLTTWTTWHTGTQCVTY